MLITAKPFVGPLRKLSFRTDNIKFVNVSRSLGVYIDSQLKWDKQVSMVAKSYSTKLSQLKRLRYLPKSALEKIYYQTIVAGIVYCMPVWGTCSPFRFNELELIHERAARIIFNLRRNVNVLQKANWRPSEYIYKKRVATLMQEKALTDLLNLFEKQSQTRTRQKHCFEIVRPRSEMRRTAQRYCGPITWNPLSAETKECKNRITFKNKLKSGKIINKVSYKKGAAIATNKLMTFTVINLDFSMHFRIVFQISVRHKSRPQPTRFLILFSNITFIFICTNL